VLALLLAAVFAALTVISGAISLGAYCSTSDGPDSRQLRSGGHRAREPIAAQPAPSHG
jgi:hypothetical protein